MMKLFLKRGIQGKNMGKLVRFVSLNDLKRIHSNRYACPVCGKGSMEAGSNNCTCGLCGQTFVIEEKACQTPV